MSDRQTDTDRWTKRHGESVGQFKTCFFIPVFLHSCLSSISNVYSNSFVHSFVYLFIHSFIHSIICSLNNSVIHSFKAFIFIFVVREVYKLVRTRPRLPHFFAVGDSHVSRSRRCVKHCRFKVHNHRRC